MTPLLTGWPGARRHTEWDRISGGDVGRRKQGSNLIHNPTSGQLQGHSIIVGYIIARLAINLTFARFDRSWWESNRKPWERLRATFDSVRNRL